ncbi:hypothetical protein QFZ49_006172 [Streptomyces turgidiscabies]|uniref:Uncharacterized protein n=1 Tax=Streptomyces turgidiscabies TaxID=85558 RepID=A0ABU0RYG5_9ACTN|nr:hypothetical protein [Streptomyces turgidiscabies]
MGPGSQQGVGRVRGVQIVVEHAVHGHAPDVVTVVPGDQFGGVGAQQVVEGVPAGHMFGEQVSANQLGQQDTGARQRYVGQRGDRRQGGVGAGVQPQQAEEPGGVGTERLVGPGEHRPYLARGLPAVQGVQASVGPAQLPGERRERQTGLGGGAGGDDRQCERQPRALADDLPYGHVLGRHPVRSQPADQQLPGLGGTEQAEGQQMGPLGGGESGQRSPAGDQRQTPGGPGQQWPDLLGVAGVVQHHQHPPPGQQAAVQPDLRLQTGRDTGRRHPEGVQEPPYRLRRAHRRPTGVEPVQIHIQLAVRKGPLSPARPVHGQRGLAHPGGTRHRRDHHRRRLVDRGGEDLLEPGEFLAAPGESAYAHGQLYGYVTRPRRR